MSIIMLSHELSPSGMDYLGQQSQIQIICHNQKNIRLVMDDFVRADGYLLRIGKLDRTMIEQAANLKVIARPGVGYDTIDIEAATEYGIPVVIAPGVNAVTVAEHTMALLLALAKNLVESSIETRKGNFGIRNRGKSVDITGKVLGVAGFGNIGREMARLARGIGMKVCVFDPFVKHNIVLENGCVSSGSWEEFLSESDFVTLHMPSVPENKNLIDREKLKLLKKGAYLINCARGDLVDEEALYDALLDGKLAGAAADMMAEEPFDTESPLMKLPNFVATPHMAALSRECSFRAAKLAVDGMMAVIRQERWPNVCNPAVYNHPRWKNKF
ncbi:MAG: hydroxyacid dehydrogenase [Lachnospiraceae bacterium]|nr:hydroxyacid dehydrogenase [Lachnospiraceae bacterium]